MSSRYDRLVPGRIALGAVRFFADIIVPSEAHCQANRGINAAGFSKLTKYCDSFRFFEAFLCPFFMGGHKLPYFRHFIVPSGKRIFKVGYNPIIAQR